MPAATANTIVSSDSEELILVDADDQETGSLSKALCHDGDGVLHRAFSVFLFNHAGELLLQQRAAGKRLWPGFWSNTCCSHPRKGETMQCATERRLEQELNISADVEFIYKFSYQANFRDLGSEHELCWVYLGRSAGQPRPNSNEISGIRYVDPALLAEELRDHGERFTPWFRMEWERLNSDFAERLAAYTAGHALPEIA